MQLQLSTLALIASAMSTVQGANKFAEKPYQQDTLDQYNVLRFTYNAGPYSSAPGFGIQRDAPDGCSVAQAHVIARHGERFPTAGLGATFIKNLERIRNFTDEVSGPLAFLPGYDFPALDDTRFDTESNRGPYAGLIDITRFGAEFRNRYDDLFAAYDDQDSIRFFAASQERVLLSAYAFAEGFLGFNIDSEDPYVVSLNETDNTQGANSLTPGSSCLNFNQSIHDDYIAGYSDDYVTTAYKRLSSWSPELNITREEVSTLLDYCGYDLNVAGRSQICELFTTDELLGRSYLADLGLYYGNGPGHNFTSVIGSTYVNAIIELFKQDNITLSGSFSHETDITKVISTLGLYDGDLPVEYIDFNAPWKSANIVPMGSRVIFEKLSCGSDATPYVRIIVNDAVIPIPKLSTGPGYSTSFENFTQYISDRLDGRTYANTCELANENVPTELTFFWEH